MPETIRYDKPVDEAIARARGGVAARGVGHAFHDDKRAGAAVRKLPEAERAGLNGPRAPIAARPGGIRRPVVEHRGGLPVGFDPARRPAVPA